MSTDRLDWLDEIDHTGDIGIRVSAGSLAELFERAAVGMFTVLADLATIEERTSTSIQVEGSDREALMVRWLSDLNYRHTVDHVVFGGFTVDAIEETADGLSLTATARGEPIDPGRHTIYTEIKAVTFHGLEIEQQNGKWTVQVIFDM